MEYRNDIKKNTILLCKNLCVDIFKWVILSIILGCAVGATVGYFNIILKQANDYRKENNYLIYFLPLAGVIIAFIYVKVKRNAYSGENLLKSEVVKASGDIPFYMSIVVFAGSLLTTLFGGSAGKEGAGVAIGGTFADFIAGKLKLSKGEQRTLVISGVGSAFGVLYDVPFTGAILGMELVIKGSFNYESLIPAFLTSVVAERISIIIGNKHITYPNLNFGEYSLMFICKLVLLGILFGAVGILFTYVLDNSSKVYGLFIKNPMIKGIAGGIITIILFFIAGDNYNGLGQSFINASFESRVSYSEFVWKIIFTAVALGSVFQGGRGNPTFFVGATFGSAVSEFVNLPVESTAALGMIGVFCSAQSLPITCIAMAVEYFGSKELMAIILVMVTSYSISGFYDIFSKRKLTGGKSTLFKGYLEE